MVKELQATTRPKKATNKRQIRVWLLFFGFGVVGRYNWNTDSSSQLHQFLRSHTANQQHVMAINNTNWNGSAAPFIESVRTLHQEVVPKQEESSSLTSTPPQGPSTTSIPIQNMSVLYYKACSGLGHRLVRQAAAHHAAHKLGFKLEARWLGCGDRRTVVNVYDELFVPETDLAYVHRTHEWFDLNNEVPYYNRARRNCWADELESYHDFYTSLKRRFQQREKIDAFVRRHFAGRFAIGIHIRAGNGEQGDFRTKNRTVDTTPHNYTQRVSQHIVDLVNNRTTTLPPVLFVATDTAHYVDLFRTQLEGIVPVVEWNQKHEPEGAGVFFGQRQKRLETKEECLEKWKDMMADMILLASTDLLIAGQYSSFSQSMPLALVMGKDPVAGKGRDSFCEVYREGEEMVCYSNKMEWCRTTKQSNQILTLGGRWPAFMNSMHSSPAYRKTG